MGTTKLSPLEIAAIAQELLKAGMHPAKVRHALSERGLHWDYQFVGQGRREKTRRLAQQGLALCKCGEGTYRINDGRFVHLCQSCLEARWRQSGPSTTPISLPGAANHTDSRLVLP